MNARRVLRAVDVRLEHRDRVELRAVRVGEDLQDNRPGGPVAQRGSAAARQSLPGSPRPLRLRPGVLRARRSKPDGCVYARRVATKACKYLAVLAELGLGEDDVVGSVDGRRLELRHVHTPRR